MEPTARSLILDLLSTLRRGTMPVRALVEAGALFGLEENNVRVSLARLHASGRVERDERGRYRLGPAVAAMRAQLQGWRTLDRRMRPWAGDWIAVHSPRLGRGASRRRRERALELLGFRDLEPGLALRPDNLRGGLGDLRARVVELTQVDVEAAADLGRIFRLRDLDPASEREARGLWDSSALVAEARASRAALEASGRRLARLPSEEAMVESFLLGGRVLRQLVRDPLLPPEILDPRPLEALIEEMRRYDELGRAHWARFLARHDVPHRGLPLDSRFEASGASSLATSPSEASFGRRATAFS